MIALLVKALYRSGIIHERYHDLAVYGGIGLCAYDGVAVIYTHIDHAFTLYIEHKEACRRGGKHAGGHGEIILDIFLGEKRSARGDLTNDGNIDDLAPAEIEFVVCRSDGAVFGAAARNSPFCLKEFQIAEDRRGGL